MLDVGEPVLDRVVAPVFLRLPVRVVPLPFGREVPPAMSRGGTTSLEQARTSATVEYPSRQSHIAGAPNGITFADQHGTSTNSQSTTSDIHNNDCGMLGMMTCSLRFRSPRGPIVGQRGRVKAPRAITHL